MATFTTSKGYYNLLGALTSMVDHDAAKFIDYDDVSRFSLASFMMVKGNSKEVGSPEFLAWAGELNPRTGAVSSTTALATGGTTLFVDSTDGVRVGDILHFPTAAEDGDNVRVSALNAASFDIQDINTRTASIATTTTFMILGEAASEMATTSVGSSWMEPAKVTNRVQIIRRSFELSRTERETDVQTSQSRLEQKAEQARLDFKKDLGLTIWFAKTVSSSGNTFMTSKGINEQLANNVTAINAAGSLAYANFSDATEAFAQFSKNTRYDAFHGSKALGGLAALGTTARVGAQDRTGPYGYAGQEISVSDFNYRLRFEKLFDELGTPYDGYCYLLDLPQITLHHLRNGKFEFRANIQADDGGEIIKSQYRAQIGIGVTWPKRHGFIRGIT